MMSPPPNGNAHEGSQPPSDAEQAPSLAASLTSAASSTNTPIQQLAAARLDAQRSPDGIPTLGARRGRGTIGRPFFVAWIARERPVWRFQYLALFVALPLVFILVWVGIARLTSPGPSATNGTVAQSPSATASATAVGIVSTGTGTPTASPTATVQVAGAPTPTTPPQVGVVPTRQPAPTATPVPPDCSTISESSASSNIYGDEGQSGTSTYLGYVSTLISITRTPNKSGGCMATGIQQIVSLYLSGSTVETNGSQCSAGAHTCGTGGIISQWNEATPSAPSTFVTSVVYGIWYGPWGPRNVYGASDPSPQTQNDPHQQQCVAAVGYYNDNFNVQHKSPSTAAYCWTNN